MGSFGSFMNEKKLESLLEPYLESCRTSTVELFFEHLRHRCLTWY